MTPLRKLLNPLKPAIKKVLFRAGVHPHTVRGGALAGMKLYLDLRTDTQIWRGIYEEALQRWLQQTLTPQSVCIDVGAAEGVMTVLMARLARDGRVLAFEPSSRGDWVARNLDLNAGRVSQNVELLRACAGSKTESSEDLGEVVSIDDAVEQRGFDRIDAIKIDVDGPELDVLDGAARTLARWHPPLCVEVHSRELLAGTLERLRPLGYTCEVVDPPPHEHRPLDYNPTVFAEHVAPMP